MLYYFVATVYVLVCFLLLIVVLLQQGKGEIGFTLGDSLAMGWAGDEEAGFKGKLDKLRGMTAIYPNYIQVVATKESGIKSLADLKGKRLSVGAPKSGTELNARAILGGAGLSYKDLGKVEEGYQEVAKRLGILPEAGVRDMKGPETVQ